VGAIRAELRHSNFLAFLLSPSRPHGLGEDILVCLLRAFISKLPHDKRPVGVLDLLTGDLDTAIVERERNNIDIFIEIKALDLAVVIENKVSAGVSEGQLSRYKQFVQSRFPGWHKLLVLLTPDGERPDDPAYDDPDYLCYSYNELADLIGKYVQDKRTSISDDVALILNNYVETLRRSIVEDADLSGKARLLYFRHREAFDFIFDARPLPEDVLEPLRILMEESSEFIVLREEAKELTYEIELQPVNYHLPYWLGHPAPAGIVR
jgi:hypothetical protein